MIRNNNNLMKSHNTFKNNNFKKSKIKKKKYKNEYKTHKRLICHDKK